MKHTHLRLVYSNGTRIDASASSNSPRKSSDSLGRIMPKMRKLNRVSPETLDLLEAVVDEFLAEHG